MSTPRLEAFLARLYTDAGFLQRFLGARQMETRRAGLSEEEEASVLSLDAETLTVAAASFRKKREKKK